ncbi:response regulator transcription factor [Flavihumibacter petaseus]|uniref:Putative two-component response regulator n=1 Tax=Flavihumibacter petaseus NBRC 106054 TaxID=1220578 RepID=A0A0E9N516_9BACT|nr:response regulator transcription factor [Flavihumibacter petaseus]GAO44883.1 putative two-component response regulator [Flavihumibacter petaseus NBRC 106054]
MSHPIRLIVADDHELLRLGFQTMLRKEKDILFIDEAQDGQELVQKAVLHRPDVIITDINMPRMDGIEATRQLQDILPNTPVIALTMFDEDSLIVEMLEAGAKGYIVKNTGKDEIISAIHTVISGEPYYCIKTTARLAGLIAGSKFNPLRKKARPEFTEREKEIILYLCQENSNKEIGEKLELSQRTIETHRERIFEKMDVRNLAGLVVYAIRNGLYKI